MRLADASIWIAFKNLGKLDILLSVPDIAIARPVVGELKRGRDSMARKIEKALEAAAFDIDIDGALSGTLSDILLLNDRRLSQTDALQVAYACANAGSVVLYMRDSPGQRQARRIGAPLRDDSQLVADMVKLRVVGPEDGADLALRLREYFTRRPRERQP